MSEGVESRLRQRRILIVEDEYYVADELSRTLRQQGADIAGPVGTLPNVREELAGEGRIDAVVLDLQLHGESSVEVADGLAERGVPFVFLTGYDDTFIPERHRDVPHLGKPCDLDRLVKVLTGFFH